MWIGSCASKTRARSNGLRGVVGRLVDQDQVMGSACGICREDALDMGKPSVLMAGDGRARWAWSL